jgi:AcrR family transcriptional regulator
VAEATHQRTRLDPEVRREQILDAAARVLADRDPADVTFEELAAAAGVSRALVYNYFGDKSGVISALYLRGLHRLSDELEQAVAPHSDDESRLRASVGCYLRFARRNGAAWRLLGYGAALDDPAVRTARRERFEVLASGWGGSHEARAVASGLTGFLEAATLVWLESGARHPDRMADLLSRVLWRGLSSVSRPQARPPGESSTRQQYQAATLR